VGWKYPLLLWLTALPLLLAAAYAVLLRRPKRRLAVRFPAHPLAEAAAQRVSPRRYVAPALFAGAATAALVAAAGPIVPLRTPTGHPVVLIIDVSRSMEETDIAPTRIEAARAAAREFVRHLPRQSRVALVTFGNYASVVVPLTERREVMQDAIIALRTQLRTQLGPGLLEGVRAVTGEGPAPPLAPGLPFRAVAILLSDGRASDGIAPEEAAQEARRRGVRVFTDHPGGTDWIPDRAFQGGISASFMACSSSRSSSTFGTRSTRKVATESCVLQARVLRSNRQRFFSKGFWWRPRSSVGAKTSNRSSG